MPNLQNICWGPVTDTIFI